MVEEPSRGQTMATVIALDIPRLACVEEPYFSLNNLNGLPEPSDPRKRNGYELRYFEILRQAYEIKDVPLDVWKVEIAVYYEMITRVDDQQGPLLPLIGGSSTYKFFVTDHGKHLGDHGLIEKWPSGVSDSLVQEPLIISVPEIPEGAVVDALRAMADLGATILHL